MIVFEEYLKELYIGNGWIAVRNGSKDDAGAEVSLYHPKTPDIISIIVQAKNHARRLTFDDTRNELLKFEEKSKIKYKLLTNYAVQPHINRNKKAEKR